MTDSKDKKPYSSTVFNNMLEGETEVAITSRGDGTFNGFGITRSNGTTHNGVDLNYQGLGQNGANLTHPTVYSPVSGEVYFGDEKTSTDGTVKIIDADGYSHQIMHLDSRTVSKGDTINAGDAIGTMGGYADGVRDKVAQHVHYQIKDTNNKFVDPEKFWDDRDPSLKKNTEVKSTETSTTSTEDDVDAKMKEIINESNNRTSVEKEGFGIE